MKLKETRIADVLEAETKLQQIQGAKTDDQTKTQELVEAAKTRAQASEDAKEQNAQTVAVDATRLLNQVAERGLAAQRQVTEEAAATEAHQTALRNSLADAEMQRLCNSLLRSFEDQRPTVLSVSEFKFAYNTCGMYTSVAASILMPLHVRGPISVVQICRRCMSVANQNACT